jgi:recombinational DNA repair ATPase RecF
MIAEARAEFVGRLAGEFRRVTEGFGMLSEVVPAWRSGLPIDESLPRALAAQLEGDVSRGYTYLSATRADLTLMRDGRRWIGSRGQNKLAGILLQLAAERCCRSIEYESPVWLVDDPSAELDARTVDAVLPMIAAAGDQILVASLSPPSGRVRDCCRPSLFHVEQGSVSARRATPPRDL